MFSALNPITLAFSGFEEKYKVVSEFQIKKKKKRI